MDKLTRIDPTLDVFKLRFDVNLLAEIRESYRQELHDALLDPENRRLFEGGQQYLQPIGRSNDKYYLATYGPHPLLWLSADAPETYQIYERFLRGLDFDSDAKRLVDFDQRLIMYAGFLVVSDRAPRSSWHADYFAGANGLTLITPLFELDRGHGNLLYRLRGDEVATYRYQLGEALIFGEEFYHCTEPYNSTDRLRVLVSISFGTDKIDHWKVLRETIAGQSRFLILPCGHRRGTCQCIASRVSLMAGRNAPCYCQSGKKFKYCHGRLELGTHA
jgi:hypothetical protein